MNICICDDDLQQHQEIKKYLQKFNKIQKNIVSYFSGEDLLVGIQNGERIDILFLDIKMKEVDGEETCRRIREIDQDMYIIFTTSLMEYAVIGYQLQINDFLLKPMTEDSFKKAFTKAIESIGKEKEVFRIKGQGKVLPFNKIFYIETLGRKLYIVTEDETLEMYGTLVQEEDKLKKYNFMKVHRAYLVNLNLIDRVLSRSIILKNNMEIPISRKKYKLIYDAYMDAVFNKYQ